MLLCTKLRIQIFDPVARDNVDTTIGCQMKVYSHVDLHMNEHLNLNPETNATH